MHIDFRPPGVWSSFNEQVTEILGVDPDKTAVRNYQGIGHALVEVTQGLAKLFPLKKKIHYIKNMNPLFEPALMLLARDGYQLTALDEKILTAPAEWAATLAREDLFVLYSVDEPLLGKAYDVAAFEHALIDKSVFRIRVSHALHQTTLDEWRTKGPIEKTQALLYAISPNWAIGLLGERGRLGALTADQVVTESQSAMGEKTEASLKSALAWFRSPNGDRQKAIVDFEARQVADSKPLFKPDDKRVYDRIAIYWPDLDGHAVIDRLARAFGFELLAPGFENRFETTSLSRWGGVRTLDFYKNLGLTPEILRGLVLIDPSFLDRGSDLEKFLLNVRGSILEDQRGDH